MKQEKRIIEINGVKMEVDMRTAKRIDTFHVGDPVKVLIKKDSYNQACIKPGVIVGFAEFQSYPAIEIMLLEDSYNGVDFKFITITTETEQKYEIIHYNDYESLFVKSNVIDKFDRDIQKRELEIEEIKRKKKYFIDDFQKAFEMIITPKE